MDTQEQLAVTLEQLASAVRSARRRLSVAPSALDQLASAKENRRGWDIRPVF